MKHCETCKHWEEKGTYTKGVGKCHNIDMIDNDVEWSQGEGRVLRKGREHVKAFVEDGSSYYAALLPTKDFGCVMHEEGTWLK